MTNSISGSERIDVAILKLETARVRIAELDTLIEYGEALILRAGREADAMDTRHDDSPASTDEIERELNDVAINAMRAHVERLRDTQARLIHEALFNACASAKITVIR